MNTPQLQVGDVIRHRRTGRLTEVSRTAAECGNVYVPNERGEGHQEISPEQWEKMPAAPAPPEPVSPTAQVNGNGHSNGNGATVPPLRSFARELSGSIRSLVP